MYGYEPPIKKQKKKGGILSLCCGGSRKKTTKSKKKSSDKKSSRKHVDSSVPVFNLEDIEEGVEGITKFCTSVQQGLLSQFALSQLLCSRMLSFEN